MEQHQQQAPSAATQTQTRWHRRADGAEIAYALTLGKAPTVVFFPGFASSMAGNKATWLEAHSRERGRAFLRFDYQGHGLSSGTFEAGDIGMWSHDATDLVSTITQGGLVLVGSSMGAWMALLAARTLGARVAGVVLVAPAPDFTELLVPGRLSEADVAALARDGRVELPSRYEGMTAVYTQRLLRSGREHTVLDRPLALECPLRILHGSADEDVPWQHGHRLFEHAASPDARMTLVKGGDHRLSSPEQLRMLGALVDEVADAGRRK